MIRAPDTAADEASVTCPTISPLLAADCAQTAAAQQNTGTMSRVLLRKKLTNPPKCLRFSAIRSQNRCRSGSVPEHQCLGMCPDMNVRCQHAPGVRWPNSGRDSALRYRWRRPVERRRREDHFKTPFTVKPRVAMKFLSDSSFVI